MESSFLSGNTRAPWGRRIGESLTLRIALLLAVVVMSTSCLAWVAFQYESYGDLICLMTAAGVCFFTGSFMLLFGSLSSKADPRSHHSGLAEVALGLIFRMGVPLLLCGIVALQLGQPLARTLARYLLILYPLALFTETWLTVTQRGYVDSSTRLLGKDGAAWPATGPVGRNQTGESL